MKLITTLSLILWLSTVSYAQMDDAAQKAWMEYMTPSKAHKQLAKEVGTWEGDVSSWMDPSQPPTKSKAKFEVKSMLNGLYIQGTYSSTMMGMPFGGQSTTGYNNAKKEYFTTWIDNMGSGIVMMTGFFDEGTNTYNFKGIQTDPMTGKDSEIREEVKWLTADSYTQTMYGAGMDGKEMKFMEATFKRVKATAKVASKKK